MCLSMTRSFARTGILIAALTSGSAFSQSIQMTESSWWNHADNGYYEEFDAFSYYDDDAIILDIETMFLFNNHEWASETDTGYTQYGWYAPVAMTIKPSNDVSLSLGYGLLYNYGDQEDLDSSDPFLRLTYSPNRFDRVVLGTLESGHNIHPALIDLSRLFESNVEQGAQWLHQSPKLRTDFWFNWRIKETEETAEEFEVAMTSEYDFGPFTNYAAVVANHRGGELTEDHSELRNYGAHFGMGYHLGFIKSRDAEFIVSYLASDFLEDETFQAGGHGVEVKYQELTHYGNSWSSKWWLSNYQGEGQAMQQGYALYQSEELQTFGVRGLYKTQSNVQIEMGFDLEMSEGDYNSSQIISFNWQHSQAF